MESHQEGQATTISHPLQLWIAETKFLASEPGGEELPSPSQLPLIAQKLYPRHSRLWIMRLWSFCASSIIGWRFQAERGKARTLGLQAPAQHPACKSSSVTPSLSSRAVAQIFPREQRQLVNTKSSKALPKGIKCIWKSVERSSSIKMHSEQWGFRWWAVKRRLVALWEQAKTLPASLVRNPGKETPKSPPGVITNFKDWPQSLLRKR